MHLGRQFREVPSGGGGPKWQVLATGKTQAFGSYENWNFEQGKLLNEYESKNGKNGKMKNDKK